MRAALVLLHRYVGLAIAGFLVVAGLTGSVLAFRPELDAWLNPDLFHTHSGGGVLLSPSQLAAVAERVDPNIQAYAIILPEKPGESALVEVGPGPDASAGPDYDQVFIDPATGRILGRRMDGAFRLDRQHVIPFLHRFHYSLHLPGLWGVWFMGVVGLAWMLDCFVGFCLTLPRGLSSWSRWKQAWSIKRGAGRHRFNLDLHRASGLWFWLVFFLLALSGVALNLKPQVFRPALSALLPTTPMIIERSPPAIPPGVMLDWDEAMASAGAAVRPRDLTVNMIYLIPAHGLYGISFGRSRDVKYGVSTIYVSSTDGRILSVEQVGGGKAGDMVQDLVFPTHSGQIAGLPGRILICIAGLAVAVLSFTGVCIWSKKRVARTRRRRPRRPSTGVSHAAE